MSKSLSTRCKCGTDAMGGCQIHNARRCRDLEAEAKRLREALEFYAHKAFEPVWSDVGGIWFFPDDGGQRARDALGERTPPPARCICPAGRGTNPGCPVCP